MLKNATGVNISQEGSTVLLTRPADPEEDLKLMAQEVRDYVEAVLNSLAANIPKVSVNFISQISLEKIWVQDDIHLISFKKWHIARLQVNGCMLLICSLFFPFCNLQAVVLCQVERAREAMLNQLYSSVRYDFDHNRVSSSFPWMSLFFTRNAE